MVNAPIQATAKMLQHILTLVPEAGPGCGSKGQHRSSLAGIGVDGAGSWTIFSHARQLFFSLAIYSTFGFALT